MAQFRNVCFTVNNPPDEPLTWPDYVSYGVYQRERGANGTVHWQGYAQLSRPVRLTVLKKWLPTAHFEKRMGTAAQARDYCMKRDDTYVDGPWEHGEFPTQGARTDMEAMREAIAAGATREEVNEQFPCAAGRCMRWRDELLNDAKKARQQLVNIDVYRPWQVDIVAIINGPNDPRSIFWFYDPVGNSGKTFMAKHMVDYHDAFYTNGGKGADICFAWEGQRIAIFDYVRDSEAFVNYGVIEQIKNGILFSTKYTSMTKRFDSPFVFIFANFFPSKDKLSKDRWRIFEILPNMTTVYHV